MSAAGIGGDGGHPRAAARRLALGLALMITMAPDARFGYFAYPAALVGWLALTGENGT